MKFLKVYLFKTIEEQFPAGISMLSHCSQAWIEWPQFFCYSIPYATGQHSAQLFLLHYRMISFIPYFTMVFAI